MNVTMGDLPKIGIKCQTDPNLSDRTFMYISESGGSTGMSQTLTRQVADYKGAC